MDWINDALQLFYNLEENKLTAIGVMAAIIGAGAAVIAIFIPLFQRNKTPDIHLHVETPKNPDPVACVEPAKHREQTTETKSPAFGDKNPHSTSSMQATELMM